MDIVYNIKKQKFKYYENEVKLNGRVLIVTEYPEFSYKEWLIDLVTQAIEQNLDFILFKNDTFLQNNNVKYTKLTNQPPVKGVIELLEDLKLSRDLTYLNIYAGGTKTRVMPFYNALSNLYLLNFSKCLMQSFDVAVYSTNINTLDEATFSRSRYKFDYLDYINNGYDVILGACTENKLKQVIEKGLKEANKYLIIYSKYFEDISPTYLYNKGDDYSFYVWEKSNRLNYTKYKTIKHKKASMEDYIKIEGEH